VSDEAPNRSEDAPPPGDEIVPEATVRAEPEPAPVIATGVPAAEVVIVRPPS
jgi:hypothetical protein